MKSLKMYLIVVFVLLLIALSFGIYTWYVFQKMNQEMAKPQNTAIHADVSIPELAPSPKTEE
jgi:flagellar basal body-associated protein FliL